MKKSNMKQSFNISGVLAAVLLFLLLGIVGAFMLFIPDMKLLYFCYVAGGVFLTYGSFLLIRYFAKKEYELVSNYDFSIGLLILLLGVLTLLRADEVVTIISIYLGIMILIEGVILLQHTIQMKQMEGVWWITLVLSIIMIGFSMIVLLNIQDFMNEYAGFFFGFLFAIGVLGIVSQILVAVRIAKYQKEMHTSFSEVAIPEDLEMLDENPKEHEERDENEKEEKEETY